MTSGCVSPPRNDSEHGSERCSNDRPNMGLGGITPAQKLHQKLKLQTAM
jgi:hypothetical protein